MSIKCKECHITLPQKGNKFVEYSKADFKKTCSDPQKNLWLGAILKKFDPRRVAIGSILQFDVENKTYQAIYKGKRDGAYIFIQANVHTTNYGSGRLLYNERWVKIF